MLLYSLSGNCWALPYELVPDQTKFSSCCLTVPRPVTARRC